MDFPEVRRITRAEYAQVWVADGAGQVVTAVTLTSAGQRYSEIAMDGELEFRMLAVDPPHQGGGVGRGVVCEIVEHAPQLPGIEAISITSATFMERAQPCTSRWVSTARGARLVRAGRGRAAVGF